MLTARSEYLDKTYLASTQIRTPEPCHRCFVGQQVIVSWDLPMDFPREGNELELALRYGDRSFETVYFTVSHRRGFKLYRILNKEYWDKKGILSYSVRLLNDGEVKARFDQKLWQDPLPDVDDDEEDSISA